MARLLLASLLLLVGADALADGPALVTTARGTVHLLLSDAEHAAPAPPFLLQPGQALKLAEGALVVVLFEGAATQISGPASLDHAGLKQEETRVQEGVDVLGELLGRHVSTAPAGVTRSGDVHLLRPIPGSTVTAPRAFAWRCEDCGEEPVVLADLLTGEVVWKAAGADGVAYDGPVLAPGAYVVQVRGRDFAFTVVDEAQRDRATRAAAIAREAAAALPHADAGARASVEAAVWWHAGLATDALYTVDDAARAHPDDASLAALREALEKRAGLAR